MKYTYGAHIVQTPLMHILFDTKLGLTVTGGDGELGDKLKRLVTRYIGLFFADIEPELNAFASSWTFAQAVR